MKRKFYLVLVTHLLLHCAVSVAQEVVITGRVLDSFTRQGIPGANVYTSLENGTSTDVAGDFTILAQPAVDTLHVSVIGYYHYRQAVGSSARHEIMLREKPALLTETVVSASRYEQRLSDVVSSMAVLRPSLIHATQTNSLDAVLQKIPGMQVLDGQPGIRGGGGYSYGAGSRVLVMMDGLPILSADAGDVKWDFLPIENIAQVEVIKGASSVLYGSSALNGVVNIRTAQPGIKPVTRAEVISGAYLNPARRALIWWGTQRPLFHGASFLHSRQMGSLDIVAGGNFFYNAGYREHTHEHRGRFNLNLRYRDKKIKGLSYGVNSNSMWLSKTSFFLWQDADSGAYRQNVDAMAPLTGYRMSVDPYLLYISGKGVKHSLKTRLYLVGNDYPDDPDKQSESALRFAEYQGSVQPDSTLQMVFGLSGYTSVNHAALYGDHRTANLAIFGQLDKRLSPQLLASVGVREEFFWMDDDRDASQPLFRAGLNYRLASFTNVRASFGQGFRYPSIAERHTATSVSSLNIFPNNTLQPEHGWSAEMGAAQGFRAGGFSGSIDAAVFMTQYKDMIEFTFGLYKPDSVLIPTVKDHVGFKSLNVGHARISGFELTVMGERKTGRAAVRFMGGYTYIYPIDLNVALTDSVKAQNGHILKYRSQHSAKMDAEIEIKRVKCGLGWSYNSVMVNVDGVFLDPFFGEAILPGYAAYRNAHDSGLHVWDLRLLYQLSQQLECSFHVRNLLNKEYMGRPGDLGPPRHMTVKVSATF